MELQKSYLSIDVPSSQEEIYRNFAQEILHIIQPHISHQNIKIPSIFHFTLDYLGSKTSDQFEEFINHSENIIPLFPKKAIHLTKLNHFVSFVDQSLVIFLESENKEYLKSLYHALEIKGWKHPENIEKSFNPHITLLEIKPPYNQELLISLIENKTFTTSFSPQFLSLYNTKKEVLNILLEK